MRVLLTAGLLFFLLPSMPSLGQPADPLTGLNKTVDSAQFYDARKYERIAAIRAEFDRSADKSPSVQYRFLTQLYDEYKVFKFDTAFFYARQLNEIANASGNGHLKADAKIKLSFILLSAGMYVETNEVLDQIKGENLPDSLRAQYFLLKGRYHYDLADYDGDDYFYTGYFRNAGAYIDSALALFPVSSFEHIYYSGLRQMKSGDIYKAFENFKRLTDNYPLTAHQLAVTASTLSFVYVTRGLLDTAIQYQAMAARADIQSSTKETFAILNLAQLLFKKGDFKTASLYIKKAIDDATAYGARQRKIQVSTIMPIIQGSEINYIEGQRRSWIIYASIISLAAVLLAFLVIVIFRQNKKLKTAQREISDAHARLHNANSNLQHANEELQRLNSSLMDLNARLEEANKIKDEYVGYFFTHNAGLFQKIEKLKKAIEEKVHYGKINEIKFILNAIDSKDEQQELLRSFDKAFLKLFPHFVRDFNALLDDEHQVQLEHGELLNTDLRIYALLRLGIRENEKIAEILQYSVKSIYAYKTKIRNRARVPKEDFDRKVMEIRSI